MAGISNRQLMLDKFSDFEKIVSAQHETIGVQYSNILDKVNTLDGRSEKIESCVNDLRDNFSTHKESVNKTISDFKLEIKDQLTDYTFLKNHPKVFFGTIIGGIAIVIFTVSVGVAQFKNAFVKVDNFISKETKEQVDDPSKSTKKNVDSPLQESNYKVK